MHFYRRMCGGFAILFIVMLLAACGALGGSNAPQAQTKATPTLPPTPTPGPGQQLLSTMAQKFNTASTLHGVFDVKITGPAFNGTENSEIWNALPNKIRTVVLQSTVGCAVSYRFNYGERWQSNLAVRSNKEGCL